MVKRQRMSESEELQIQSGAFNNQILYQQAYRQLPKLYHTQFDRAELASYRNQARTKSEAHKLFLENSLTPQAHHSREQQKVLPHTKRIDIIYLHLVHGFTRNKIALTFDHHFITVNKIVNTYKQCGLTSLPYKTNCPVNYAQMLKNEVSVLDLKAIEEDQSSLTDECIFGHFLSGNHLKKRDLPNVFLNEQISSN